MKLLNLRYVKKSVLLPFLILLILMSSIGVILPSLRLGIFGFSQSVHDIAVSDVTVNATVVAPGEAVNITVVVENQGNFAEIFNVTVFYDSNSIDKKEDALRVGENLTLSFTWDTSGVVAGNYTIKAEATAVPGETETADNTFSDGAVVVTNTKIQVDPLLYSKNPGESFTLDVNITNVIDLFSYEVYIGFDGTILEAVDAKEGPFIKDGTTSPYGTFFSYTPSMSYIYVVCTTLMRYPGVSGNGTLFNATFTVKTAPTPGTGTSALHLYDTLLYNSTTPVPFEIPHRTYDGTFYTTYPKAKFTYSPHPFLDGKPGRPIVGETVTFNATESYDPDDPYDSTPGGIVSYAWKFKNETGDLVGTGTGSVTTHKFTESGIYSANLTVTDDEGETDTEVLATITIQLHDIAVINVTVTPPTEVLSGSTVTINATVLNEGSIKEHYNITAFYNYNPINTTTRFDLDAGKNATVTLTWNTTGVPEGTYTIGVNACIVYRTPPYESRADEEADISDNAMLYGSFEIVGTPVHDLAITDVEAKPTNLKLNFTSDIEMTILNEGNTDENFNLTVAILHDSSEFRPPKSWTNQTISAGVEEKLKWTKWYEANDTAKEGTFEITASIVIVNKTTLEEITDSDTADNTRFDLASMNIYPVANFTYSPSQPLVEETVTFNASSSYAPGDPGGNITDYAWDFGDGTEVTVSDPVINHTFRWAKTFTVTLKVTDERPLASSASESVTVSAFHNIVITNVTFSPHTVTSGEHVSIKVTLMSRFYEESFNVTTYFSESEIDTSNVTLSLGDTITLAFEWNTTGVAGGNYTIKAVANTATENVTYIGGIVTVGRLPSTISITASATTFTIGTATIINGTLSSLQPMANVDVTIDYKLSDEETWNVLATVTTESDGTYSHSWTPETAGTYAIKASWQGDSIVMPSESEAAVVIVQEVPQLNLYLFTTAGLAIVIVALIVYFVKLRKS